MSMETLKLEKGLCRCCHNEGIHKNLADPCLKAGEVEIYIDMLQSCLDINLTPLPGPHCAVTYTICETCIERLRDACSFKKQVNECEQRFREYFTKNDIKLASCAEIEVKRENTDDEDVEVKVNLSPIHDDDDFRDDFVDDDDTKVEVDEDIKSGPRKLRSKKAKAPEKPKAKSKSARKPKDETAKNTESRKKGHRLDYYRVIDNKYACTQCERSFASQPLVSQHHRFVHLKRRPRERKCPHCDIKVPGYLRAYHLEEVHSIPAPSCSICQRRFRYPCYVLQHHKKVHMAEKTVYCNVCDKGFFDALTLKSHMLTHSSEKRFTCDICGQAFRWKNNLKDHILIHMGEKSYACKVCGDEAIQYTLTQDHEKKYQCNVCQRAYSKQALFSQHYKHVHLKLRPKLRACYLCEVRVPGYMRARHLEEAHGVQRPMCNACGKKFAYPFQVIHHQRQFHMDEKFFPCAKCEMKFSTPSRLARHEHKHSTRRPHKCDYCEKAFKWKKNLKTHIMIHLNDRRHVCVVCREAFVQQTSLKYHMSKRHPEMV